MLLEYYEHKRRGEVQHVAWRCKDAETALLLQATDTLSNASGKFRIPEPKRPNIILLNGASELARFPGVLSVQIPGVEKPGRSCWQRRKEELKEQ